MIRLFSWLTCAWALVVGSAWAEEPALRVPAATAYVDPDVTGAKVGRKAITEWIGPKNQILWFGELRQPGPLEVSLSLSLPADATSKLRLRVGQEAREAEAKAGTVSFGSFDIKEPGYVRLALESRNAEGQPNGDLEALTLFGPASKDARFNLNHRRNAASVHLTYPVPEGSKVEAFYCEVTAVDDPVWTFYMACGWHRGYFGMQVNTANERRIIFSVWDSGDEARDRDKVAPENLVSLLGKGEGVVTANFGNEGTGGHSHFKYAWKTGEKQRFLLTAKPADDTHTDYSGYYFHPEKLAWMLITSMRAPKDGSHARGLHSFSENFGGGNGHIRRKALFGNQWIKTSDGQWHELTRATFSHDATGKADRLDRFMGVEAGQFFLSHGGFLPGSMPSGQAFGRPALGQAPELALPAVEAK